MSKHYKKPVAWFAEQMCKKLGLPQNKAKAHWKTVSNNFLFDLLGREVTELEDALADEFHGGNDEIEAIISECSDVANFAMMIADNARRGKFKRKP